jgi:hypothetical protein
MFPKLDPSTLNKDTQYPDVQAQELPFAAAKRLKTPAIYFEWQPRREARLSGEAKKFQKWRPSLEQLAESQKFHGQPVTHFPRAKQRFDRRKPANTDRAPQVERFGVR